MPVRKCQLRGRPGFQWGSGACYTYTAGDDKSRDAAHAKATQQGSAAYSSGYSMTVAHKEMNMEDPMIAHAMLKDLAGAIEMMGRVGHDDLRSILSAIHDRYASMIDTHMDVDVDVDVDVDTDHPDERSKYKRMRASARKGDDPIYDAVDDPSRSQRASLPAAAFEPSAFFEGSGGSYASGGAFLVSKSKLPHHINTVKNPDDNKSVDLPRLRNALARFDQVDWAGFPSGTEKKSRAHLERHADALLKGREQEGSGCATCSDEGLAALELDIVDFRAGNFGAIRERLK